MLPSAAAHACFCHTREPRHSAATPWTLQLWRRKRGKVHLPSGQRNLRDARHNIVLRTRGLLQRSEVCLVHILGCWDSVGASDRNTSGSTRKISGGGTSGHRGRRIEGSGCSGRSGRRLGSHRNGRRIGRRCDRGRIGSNGNIRNVGHRRSRLGRSRLGRSHLGRSHLGRSRQRQRRPVVPQDGRHQAREHHQPQRQQPLPVVLRPLGPRAGLGRVFLGVSHGVYWLKMVYCDALSPVSPSPL